MKESTEKSECIDSTDSNEKILSTTNSGQNLYSSQNNISTYGSQNQNDEESQIHNFEYTDMESFQYENAEYHNSFDYQHHNEIPYDHFYVPDYLNAYQNLSYNDINNYDQSSFENHFQYHPCFQSIDSTYSFPDSYIQPENGNTFNCWADQTEKNIKNEECVMFETNMNDHNDKTIQNSIKLETLVNVDENKVNLNESAFTCLHTADDIFILAISVMLNENHNDVSDFNFFENDQQSQKCHAKNKISHLIRRRPTEVEKNKFRPGSTFVFTGGLIIKQIEKFLLNSNGYFPGYVQDDENVKETEKKYIFLKERIKELNKKSIRRWTDAFSWSTKKRCGYFSLYVRDRIYDNFCMSYYKPERGKEQKYNSYQSHMTNESSKNHISYPLDNESYDKMNRFCRIKNLKNNMVKKIAILQIYCKPVVKSILIDCVLNKMTNSYYQKEDFHDLFSMNVFRKNSQQSNYLTYEFFCSNIKINGTSIDKDDFILLDTLHIVNYTCVYDELENFCCEKYIKYCYFIDKMVKNSIKKSVYNSDIVTIELPFDILLSFFDVHCTQNIRKKYHNINFNLFNVKLVLKFKNRKPSNISTYEFLHRISINNGNKKCYRFVNEDDENSDFSGMH